MSPYLLLPNVETAIKIPETGMSNQTLFSDDAVKILGFGFAAGHLLASHTAPMAVMLYFVSGEAELTIDGETKAVSHGSLVHLTAGVTHSVLAKTRVAMLLLMLKQSR